MSEAPAHSNEAFLEKAQLDRLIRVLIDDGYRVVGPTIDQQAIVYGDIQSASQLPIGWSDQQGPGIYRLSPSGKDTYFAFNVGPHSWKQFLFPPRSVVATADRSESGWRMDVPEPSPSKFAFLGVRACELKAIEIQDRIFMGGPYRDPIYQARRENALIVSVHCTQAAATCFCTSMNSGPRAREGFDLALTEIDQGFVVEVGSERGATILAKLDHRPLTERHAESATSERQRAIDQIGKEMNTDNLRDLLLKNLEHPRWDQVAERCLSCTNCTMVCPTCFCSTVSEVSDLQGDHIERQRTWDSCFHVDFSYIVGGVVRNDRRSRYRQWLTHKLASWHDQFDSSGCVGCGRCIAWCPVGIDLTEEVAAIRADPERRRSLPMVPSHDVSQHPSAKGSP